MTTTHALWFGLIIGIIIGACVPMLWGDSIISIASFVGAVIGGIVGTHISAFFTGR